MPGLDLVTAGQGTFVFGIEPTARILVDSTKGITVTAEAAGGFPVALIATSARLDTNPTAVADMFYGALSSDVNKFSGRVSLGEFEAKKVNAELLGRYTIRRSRYTDSNGDEVVASPFSALAANGAAAASSFPVQADIGKSLDAIRVLVTDSADAFDAETMLKWAVGDGSTSVGGFAAVAKLINVSDSGEEVEIQLSGIFSNFSASFTSSN